MSERAFRPASVLALAGLLVVAGLAPADADGPPTPDWQLVSSDTVDGMTYTWHTATVTYEPFGLTDVLDLMPIYLPDVVNNSGETRYIALGTDLETPGVMNEIWTPEGWGAFATAALQVGLGGSFWFELPNGTSFADVAAFPNGLPAWSGHTITIFELDGPPPRYEGDPQDYVPDPDANPLATPRLSISTPGRHVPADLSTGDVSNISAAMGKRVTVAGTDGAPELFAGVTATATASGLTPGDQLELWMLPLGSSAFHQIFGGGLPTDAIRVGDGTVGPDGTLSAAFTVPSTAPVQQYHLTAGVRAERYWPAGTYDDFTVTIPTSQQSQSSPANPTQPVTFDLANTGVSLTFPATAGGGTTTVTASTTGPTPTGFQIPGWQTLYFHIDSTVVFEDPVTVCIEYDSAQFGSQVPTLYHFDTALNRWVNITTSRDGGVVCGETYSFSPFVVGIPDQWPFDGFDPPVSNTEPNLAKAGQAIPVKFSLGGDRGLDVITSATFSDAGIATTLTGEPVDAIAATRSSLSYDPASDTYTYVWKTAKAWASHTGTFVLELADGSTHTFDVTFRK